MEPRTFEVSYKPFSQASERFPLYKRDITEINPGPGSYDHELDQNRHIKWQEAFGTTPINLPEVKVHSTIHKNTEKLMSTKEEKKFKRRLAYLKLYY
ncbi:hypothetical protein NP493_289g01036 [Ridgeia piscesae]|uniref:Uncharacterized protein n=1 Tax=Ridgeia piscesae TaxID=27915 RepID=A0AAD9UC17_RIDPI|nr:hypothetical protein NP493_289g01036 [Ridgeia piscesae]